MGNCMAMKTRWRMVSPFIPEAALSGCRPVIRSLAVLPGQEGMLLVRRGDRDTQAESCVRSTGSQ